MIRHQRAPARPRFRALQVLYSTVNIELDHWKTKIEEGDSPGAAYWQERHAALSETVAWLEHKLSTAWAQTTETERSVLAAAERKRSMAIGACDE